MAVKVRKVQKFKGPKVQGRAVVIVQQWYAVQGSDTTMLTMGMLPVS